MIKKINSQKSLAFLYTKSKHMEKEFCNRPKGNKMVWNKHSQGEKSLQCKFENPKEKDWERHLKQTKASYVHGSVQFNC